MSSTWSPIKVTRSRQRPVSASGWQQVVDQIGARMDSWLDTLYQNMPPPDLELQSTPTTLVTAPVDPAPAAALHQAAGAEVIRDHRSGTAFALRASHFEGIVAAERQQAIATASTFTLHLVPVMGALDYATEGNLKDAAISLGGDAALFLGGPLAKVAGSSAKMASLGVKTSRLHAASAAIQTSIGVYSVGEGVYSIHRGDHSGAAGYFGDAVLRLFGATASFENAATATAEAKAAAAPRGTPHISPITGRPVDLGGRIRHIKPADGPTRFTPLRENGHPVAAGMGHVLARHFGGANNQSQFTITPGELKIILQGQAVRDAPLRQVGTGRQAMWVRDVNIGQIIGRTRVADGANPTSMIRVFVDEAGNLITTFPIP